MGVNVSQKQDEPVLPNQWSLIHRTRQIHVNETKTKNREKESLRVKMPDKASYSKEKAMQPSVSGSSPFTKRLAAGSSEMNHHAVATHLTPQSSRVHIVD